MLNKIKAICNFKEMSINDLEEINDNIFTIDNEEYYVLTDNEAQEMYEEMQKDLIEEIGLYGFTEFAQEYIINNCLDMQYFDDCLYELNMDDVYENGLEFFQEIYTDEEINEIINKNHLMDIDKVIAYCQEIDGRGHIIAPYDGEENIIEIEGEDYYIYRIS